jgi:hypothetical protein
MGTVTGQSIGIDISEDFLDVYLHPGGKVVRLPYNDEGTTSLLALLREHLIERRSGRAPRGCVVCAKRRTPRGRPGGALFGSKPSIRIDRESRPGGCRVGLGMS